MIGLIVEKLLEAGVQSKWARPVAWAIIAVVIIVALVIAKMVYDQSVIDNALEGANAEQLERKDEVTGEADKRSEDRRQKHVERIQTTEELIDEALENGCAVGEYLATGGSVCVQG